MFTMAFLLSLCSHTFDKLYFPQKYWLSAAAGLGTTVEFRT